MITQISQTLSSRGWWTGHFQGELLLLARQLGHPVPTRSRGPLVDALTIRDRDRANKNSLSSRYGIGEFPFHNDAAHHQVVPKYVLLRYLNSIPSHRGTVLFDFTQSLTEFQSELISRELWIVHTGKKAFLSPILDGNYLRYDPSIMTPALGSRAKTPGILKTILATSPVEKVFWSQFTTVVIDNHRVLHSRQGQPPNGSTEENRLLERVLVRSYELEN